MEWGTINSCQGGSSKISTTPTSIIWVYKQYDELLKWVKRVKDLAEVYINGIMNGWNGLTGLRFFMVDVIRNCHDFSGIYGMIGISSITSTWVHEQKRKNKIALFKKKLYLVTVLFDVVYSLQ